MISDVDSTRMDLHDVRATPLVTIQVFMLASRRETFSSVFAKRPATRSGAIFHHLGGRRQQ